MRNLRTILVVGLPLLTWGRQQGEFAPAGPDASGPPAASAPAGIPPAATDPRAPEPDRGQPTFLPPELPS